MYKVGDRVRVVRLVNDYDERCLKIGSIHTVMGIRKVDGAVFIRVASNNNYVMLKSQIEKVEESKKMTFPEMVQKLIDGDFEVGTELINSYEFYEKSYWVHQSENTGNFGLSVSKYEDILKVELEGTDINGLWTVKEEIKEMSFEELQKELGYKIKIVE